MRVCVQLARIIACYTTLHPCIALVDTLLFETQALVTAILCLSSHPKYGNPRDFTPTHIPPNQQLRHVGQRTLPP